MQTFKWCARDLSVRKHAWWSVLEYKSASGHDLPSITRENIAPHGVILLNFYYDGLRSTIFEVVALRVWTWSFVHNEKNIACSAWLQCTMVCLVEFYYDGLRTDNLRTRDTWFRENSRLSGALDASRSTRDGSIMIGWEFVDRTCCSPRMSFLERSKTFKWCIVFGWEEVCLQRTVLSCRICVAMVSGRQSLKCCAVSEYESVSGQGLSSITRENIAAHSAVLRSSIFLLLWIKEGCANGDVQNLMMKSTFPYSQGCLEHRCVYESNSARVVTAEW